MSADQGGKFNTGRTRTHCQIAIVRQSVFAGPRCTSNRSRSTSQLDLFAYGSRHKYGWVASTHRRIRLCLAFPVGVAIALVPIVLPLKWLQVGQIVCTAFSNGLDVVNFPAPLLRFAVLGPLHARAACICAESGIEGFWRPLFPDSFNRCFAEGLSPRVGIRTSAHSASSLARLCVAAQTGVALPESDSRKQRKCFMLITQSRRQTGSFLSHACPDASFSGLIRTQVGRSFKKLCPPSQVVHYP